MTPKKVSQKRKRRTTFVVDATCTSDGERYTVSEMSGTSEWITVSLQLAPTQPRRRIGFDTSGKTASRKGRKS